MPFSFKKMEIPDVLLITPKLFGDDRGYIVETFKQSEFEINGIQYHFVQDNESKSKAGVLRGVHYQLRPKEQGKLVRVVQGKLFDDVVDIRKGSPYYGKWLGVTLTAESKQMLWVPPGFAHGVCILEDNTVHTYKVTNEYSPEHDRGILWNDPKIGIQWPLNHPSLSSKDQNQPTLEQADNNFTY